MNNNQNNQLVQQHTSSILQSLDTKVQAKLILSDLRTGKYSNIVRAIPFEISSQSVDELISVAKTANSREEIVLEVVYELLVSGNIITEERILQTNQVLKNYQWRRRKKQINHPTASKNQNTSKN